MVLSICFSYVGSDIWKAKTPSYGCVLGGFGEIPILLLEHYLKAHPHMALSR